MPSPEADRLLLLPAAARDALARARALGPEHKEFDEALKEAFVAVAFPSGDALILATLTPPQRALAELIAEGDALRPNFPYHGFPNGKDARVWLGLEGGVLATPVRFGVSEVPLWRALHLAGKVKGDWGAALAVLDALPPGLAIEALGELADWRFGIDVSDLFAAGRPAAFQSLGGEAAPWARAAATDWATRAKEAEAAGKKPWQYAMRDLRALCVFYALIRAAVPIEPEWEPLFPPPPSIQGELAFDLVVACARGLSDERRVPVLVAALEHHKTHAFRTGHALLAEWDDDALARAVVRRAAESTSPSPKLARQALDELATTRPALRAVLDEGRKPKPIPPPRQPQTPEERAAKRKGTPRRR